MRARRRAEVESAKVEALRARLEEQEEAARLERLAKIGVRVVRPRARGHDDSRTSRES